MYSLSTTSSKVEEHIPGRVAGNEAHPPCRLQTAMQTIMQMSEAISVECIEIHYYQFLEVTMSLGCLYINPFSWIEWHIERQFSTERVHSLLLSCSYQLPLTPSLFYLFLCFSFFFIIKNMRNNNIIRIGIEGDRSLVQNVEGEPGHYYSLNSLSFCHSIRETAIYIKRPRDITPLRNWY